jgi:hypothetical protein
MSYSRNPKGNGLSAEHHVGVIRNDYLPWLQALSLKTVQQLFSPETTLAGWSLEFRSLLKRCVMQRQKLPGLKDLVLE